MATTWYAQDNGNIDAVDGGGVSTIWYSTANGSGGSWLTWAALANDDILRANGKTITLNVDVPTCVQIDTETSGGGFTDATTTPTTRTINANVLAGTTTCVTKSGTGHLAVNGNAQGGTSSDARGLNATDGTWAISGTAQAGSGTNAHAVRKTNGGANSIGVDAIGGGSSAYGLNCDGGGTVSIGQDAKGGTGGSAFGLLTVWGVVTITRHAIGGAAGSTGARNQTTGASIIVLGDAIGSTTSTAPGVENTTTGTCRVAGNVTSNTGPGVAGATGTIQLNGTAAQTYNSTSAASIGNLLITGDDVTFASDVECEDYDVVDAGSVDHAGFGLEVNGDLTIDNGAADEWTMGGGDVICRGDFDWTAALGICDLDGGTLYMEGTAGELNAPYNAAPLRYLDAVEFGADTTITSARCGTCVVDAGVDLTFDGPFHCEGNLMVPAGASHSGTGTVTVGGNAALNGTQASRIYWDGPGLAVTGTATASWCSFKNSASTGTVILAASCFDAGGNVGIWFETISTADVEALINARTLPAADYFDPSTDVVARVTLVDTTTTNTDMRGTDNAALAATALSNAVWTDAKAAFIDAAISSLSTYDGSDTAGTTTLLSRIVGTLDAGTHKPSSGDAYQTALNTNSILGSLTQVVIGVGVVFRETAYHFQPDTAGTTTLLSRLVGTILAGDHSPQSGDAYAVVNSVTHGNAALKVLIDTVDTVADAIKVEVDKVPRQDTTYKWTNTVTAAEATVIIEAP